MNLRNRLATITDEVCDDARQAMQLCTAMGIGQFELRQVAGRRLPDIEPATVEQLREGIAAIGARIVGLSVGFCKHDLNDAARHQAELTVALPRAISLIDRLGSDRRLTIFGGARDEAARTPAARNAPIPPVVVDRVGSIVAAARAAGIEAIIENSAMCWANSGDNLSRLAEAVNARVVWDPANAQAAGETAFPDGYRHVRDRIAHVHVKNFRPSAGCVDIPDGLVDWTGQIRALNAHAYSGLFCIEPHQRRDGAAAIERNAEILLRLLATTPCSVPRGVEVE